MTAMQFDVMPEEKSIANAQRSSGWAKNLAAALGNGAEWEYSGEVSECAAADGKCACGHHGLRYLFTLRHPDGRSVEVGSSCVLSYPGISRELVERMQADIENLKKLAADRIRAAKKAAEDSRVQELLNKWSEIEYECDRLVDAWKAHNWNVRFQPGPMYYRCCCGDRLAMRQDGKLHPFVRVPAMKTAKGQIARLEKAITKAERNLNSIREVRSY